MKNPSAELRAHRTQHQSVDRHLFDKPDLDRILAREIWRQGFGPPVLRRPADDICSGLETTR